MPCDTHQCIRKPSVDISQIWGAPDGAGVEGWGGVFVPFSLLLAAFGSMTDKVGGLLRSSLVKGWNNSAA